jgi:hypothetical protein
MHALFIVKQNSNQNSILEWIYGFFAGVLSAMPNGLAGSH